MENKELLELILSNEKNREITLMTVEGLIKVSLDDLLNQNAQGILYDLNRDKASIMSMADGKSKRWVNDYATACVIEELKAQNIALIKKIEEQNEVIHELQLKNEKTSSINIEYEKSNKTKETPKQLTTPISTMNGYRIDGISNETVFQM